MRKLYEILMSVSINKVLLKYSRACPFYPLSMAVYVHKGRAESLK